LDHFSGGCCIHHKRRIGSTPGTAGSWRHGFRELTVLDFFSLLCGKSVCNRLLQPFLYAVADKRVIFRLGKGTHEDAFEALVTRHGPMVLWVCRSALRDSHDAEDAFQATFLVLARKCWIERKRGRIQRPSEFETLSGTGLRVYTLKRELPAPAAPLPPVSR